MSGIVEPSSSSRTVTSCPREVSDESNERYNLLITKAPYISGTEEALIPFEEIPWFDKTLLDESVSFHRRHFTQIVLTNTVALMFGFCVKPNSAVILRTGKLHDPELSFQRYLSTCQRIAKFFALPFHPDKSYSAFDIVRKMHIHASKKWPDDEDRKPQNSKFRDAWKEEMAEAMRKDLEHVDTSSAPKHLLTWDPPVPLSQFDMATTLFGFIGTLWMFPRAFGIQDREKELRGMLHMWAVFGRLLGIRDEFNVCINPDPALLEKMFRNIVVESLKTMDETVVTIQYAFVQAFRKRMPIFTYKAMLFVGLQNVEGYAGENLQKLMTSVDKLSVNVLQLWLWALKNSRIFSFFSHVFIGLWLQFQFWRNLKTSTFS